MVGDGVPYLRRLLAFTFVRFSSRGAFRDELAPTGSVPGTSANCNRICCRSTRSRITSTLSPTRKQCPVRAPQIVRSVSRKL